MVSFSTWRAFYRIPWLRDNREAVRILREMSYLLMALYRANRLQEFSRLRYLYFKMIHSFAQYGRRDAKDTVDQILRIPWFRENRLHLYRLISTYNRVVHKVLEQEGHPSSISIQAQINNDTEIFFHEFKALMHFDERDERRVDRLLKDRRSLDENLRNLHQTLGH
jgi:hypothetical protein